MKVLASRFQVIQLLQFQLISIIRINFKLQFKTFPFSFVYTNVWKALFSPSFLPSCLFKISLAVSLTELQLIFSLSVYQGDSLWGVLLQRVGVSYYMPSLGQELYFHPLALESVNSMRIRDSAHLGWSRIHRGKTGCGGLLTFQGPANILLLFSKSYLLQSYENI